MKTRRRFIFSLITGSLGFAINTSWAAAAPTIEIIAMAHPPVQSALKPLRDWLAQQGGKLKVVEIDAESPQGEQRLSAVGLGGHIPVLILIDGKYQHRRQDGSAVSFVNFPAVKESPSGIRGDWQIADVQALLTERISKR